MSQPKDMSKKSPVAFDQDSTLVVAVEVSQESWLVGALVPGVERSPRKKLAPDPEALLHLLGRWREQAAKAGKTIARTAVAYEAGRDGFWLARWLRARGIEAYVIHPTSVAVSREHRRAKTDRLDLALLIRAFLGWLRGEEAHCSMAPVPTAAEEDARRPNRERAALVRERTRLVNRMKATLARHGVRGVDPRRRRDAARLAALRTPEGGPLPPHTRAELDRALERMRLLDEQIAAIERERRLRVRGTPEAPAHHMVLTLERVVALGIETADLLAHEAFARPLRDSRAVARFGGLTGAPDESGKRRREKGLARAGNARVRCAMIQFAWRFLRFQPDSPLAQWYRERTRSGRGDIRKTMIVALARKLLIALWRLATTGELPEGIAMRPAR